MVWKSRSTYIIHTAIAHPVSVIDWLMTGVAWDRMLAADWHDWDDGHRHHYLLEGGVDRRHRRGATRGIKGQPLLLFSTLPDLRSASQSLSHRQTALSSISIHKANLVTPKVQDGFWLGYVQTLSPQVAVLPRPTSLNNDVISPGESQDAHQEVYKKHGGYSNESTAHEAKFSHELIAGAAAFEGFKLFEDHQRKQGSPPLHIPLVRIPS